MQENEYEGLDEMFKSGLENSRISPPPGVWEGVAASVAGSGAGVGAGIGIFGKVILGVAVSAGLGVGAYFYIESRKEQAQLPKDNNKQEQVIAPEKDGIAAEKQADPEARSGTARFIPPNVLTHDHVSEAAPGSNSDLFDSEGESILYGTVGQGTNTYESDFPSAGKTTSPGPCSHNGSISTQKMTDERFIFTLNYPNTAAAITWYVNGVAEYNQNLAHAWSYDKTFNTESRKDFAVKAKIRSGNCWDSVMSNVKLIVPEEPKLPSKFSMPFNAFSPNGDDYNEVLFVEIENQDYFELNVFDKNNRQMFRSDKPEVRWTGKCGVNDCPVGTYLVVVKYRFKGESEYRYKRMNIELTR